MATNHVSGETAALVYLLAFVPVGVFFALREPWPGAITVRTWTLVLALGFFLAFGNYAMLAAFARGGKAAIIAPLGGLYPLISVPRSRPAILRRDHAVEQIRLVAAR